MKLIDISHTLSNESPVYPGTTEISITKNKTLENDYYNAYVMISGFHVGTHIDIPMHLTEDEKMVKDFPLDDFIGKGILLDVRGENSIVMKTSYEDTVVNDSIVLLYTGFDQHYYEDRYFKQHPTVDSKLTDFLISKKIKMLGMDMPAPDFPPFPCHKALFSNGIYVIENLTNLQNLLEIDNFEVIAFPLKISAEASFARVVCRLTC